MVIKTAWSGDYYVRNRALCKVALLSISKCLPETKLLLYQTESSEEQELLDLVPDLEIIQIPNLENIFNSFYDWSRFYILSFNEEPECLWLDPDTISFRPFNFDGLDSKKVYALLGEHYWRNGYSLQGPNTCLKEISPFKENLDTLDFLKPYGFNGGLLFFPEAKYAQIYGKAGLESLKALAINREFLSDTWTAHHFAAQSYPYRKLRQEGVFTESFFSLVCPFPEIVKSFEERHERLLDVYSYLFPYFYHRCYALPDMGGELFHQSLAKILPSLQNNLRCGNGISFASFCIEMKRYAGQFHTMQESKTLL